MDVCLMGWCRRWWWSAVVVVVVVGGGWDERIFVTVRLRLNCYQVFLGVV